jgi:hypothetical protein
VLGNLKETSFWGILDRIGKEIVEDGGQKIGIGFKSGSCFWKGKLDSQAFSFCLAMEDVPAFSGSLPKREGLNLRF